MFAFKSLLFASATYAALAAASQPSIRLKTYVDTLDLHFNFDPVIAAYWTGLPHHRRTPFAVSPDGKTGFLAYLDARGTDVHLQHVEMRTMRSKEPTITIPNVKEAAIYRYHNGKQQWKTFIAGPGVHPSDGLSMAPDMNGDLVWSEKAGLYGAYFVVTDYTGFAEGHFGDSIQYVDDSGHLKVLSDASSSWGCSHNTGIAFEAADEPPFASICAEDQGAIWLNTNTRGMSNNGVKISNENTTNGGSGEPMGGMSGSYSALARFVNSTSYIFAWVSRGAVDLTENTWMGEGYTHSLNRTNGRRTAVAAFSDKGSIVGPQASSKVGAVSGDSQVNWITPSEGPDRSNAHVAVFDDTYAMVTWEEIARPECAFVAMGCSGTFSGTFFQLVDKSGKKIGDPLKSMHTYVAGDMVTTGSRQICWPYVTMDWRLDLPVGGRLPEHTTKKMSFACASLV